MSKFKTWVFDMLILAIPFTIDATGKYISKHLEQGIKEPNMDYLFRQSHAYTLAIALTYMSLQLLWIFAYKYSLKYKHEMLLYLLLIGNNLLDAIGNYYPTFGVNSYDFGVSECIIFGLFVLLIIRRGYLNFKA